MWLANRQFEGAITLRCDVSESDFRVVLIFYLMLPGQFQRVFESYWLANLRTNHHPGIQEGSGRQQSYDMKKFIGYGFLSARMTRGGVI